MMKTLWKNTGRLNKRAKKLALQITYGAAIVNMTMTGTVHAGKLHKALELEQHEVVSRLLKAGSDPDLQNLCELSPLQIAVGKNSLFMTDLLIDAGADVNATDPVQLSTALHLAAYLGDVDTLILLIERGANIDQQDIMGYTPLIRAVYGGRKNAVIALLRKGADSTETDYIHGRTAAEIASFVGHHDIAKQILRHNNKT